MSNGDTPGRIVLAALTVFLRQGVRGTSLNEVAFEAGVTRVTVYRYFGDKARLVRAVCMRIASAFERAAAGSPDDTIGDLDARLNGLGLELNGLPKGNLLSRLDEISRLYPAVYEEFRAARQRSIDAIFRQALAVAGREAAIREGLNHEVLKAIFWASVVGLIENPALISSNVPLAEVFATVTEVFRHGILKMGGSHGG
jgi:AcrR family transcriptional regulator